MAEKNPTVILTAVIGPDGAVSSNVLVDGKQADVLLGVVVTGEVSGQFLTGVEGSAARVRAAEQRLASLADTLFEARLDALVEVRVREELDRLSSIAATLDEPPTNTEVIADGPPGDDTPDE